MARFPTDAVRPGLRLLPGVFFLWASPLPAQTYTNADAISREVSVFNLGQSAAAFEANSREVSLFNLGQASASYEAISREVSLFNLGQSSSRSEALSREVSLFNLGQSAAGGEAISREVSLFNLGLSSAHAEAISREVSVANLGSSLGNLEAISREVSLFNLGQASAGVEGISREVSVYVSGKPVLVSMGGLIIGTGTTGQVPIYLASEVALTNVEMTWVTSPGRVTGVTVEPIVPQICSSAVTPQSNGQVHIEFATCPGQSLVGTQQIAWLMFTLPEGQLSTFLYPSLTNQQVSELNGFTTTNSVGQLSRLVVLDDEPLLEMLRTTNLQPLLVLYGKPATNYAVEWSMNLPAGQWQPVLTDLTIGPSLFLEFAPPPGDGPYGFYRGVRGNRLSAPPLLLAFAGPNGQLGLSLRGQPGYLYGIDRTASISSPQWSSWEQIALTNAAATIYVTPVAPTQFYRARLIGAASP